MAGISEKIISGKKIMIVDYSGCKTPELMIQVYDESVKFVLDKNKPYLILAKFTGSYITRPFIHHIEKEGTRIWHLVKKSAFIGMNNPKQMILKTFNMEKNFSDYSFNSEDEAINFLWRIKSLVLLLVF
jgi:hypothetical protein